MADGAELLKHPVVTAAAGAAATAAGVAGQAYLACERLPLLGPPLRGVADLSRRGELVIDHSVEPLRALIATVAVQVVELVLDELDLTDLIRRRVDLLGLADEVIDGVDLQGDHQAVDRNGDRRCDVRCPRSG